MNKKTAHLPLLCIAALLATSSVHADPLNDGWIAYKKGNIEEAYDLFFNAFRANPSDPQINFALGEACIKKGKFSHAIFAYDRALNANPTHQRARYGKANALLALNQPEDARAEFDALLKQEIKPDVRKNIEQRIKKLDQASKRWKTDASVSVSVFYDDNINFGPAEDVVSTLVGTLQNNAPQKDAWGLGLSATGVATYDLGAKGSWRAIGGASIYHTSLDDAPAQELLYSRIFVGLRNIERDRMTELIARIDRLDYGHDHLLDTYGIDLSHLRALNAKNHLTGRLSIEHRDFDTDTSSNSRDSIYSTASLSWKHLFANRRNHTEITAGLFSDYAREKVNRNCGFTLKAGGELELPARVIGYASGQYRATTYDDPQAGIFADEREDQQYTWITGIRRPISKHWTIDLQHRYIRNDSNLGLYDYARRLVTLTATCKF